MEEPAATIFILYYQTGIMWTFFGKSVHYTFSIYIQQKQNPGGCLKDEEELEHSQHPQGQNSFFGCITVSSLGA